jgi:hypothetical protein
MSVQPLKRPRLWVSRKVCQMTSLPQASSCLIREGSNMACASSMRLDVIGIGSFMVKVSLHDSSSCVLDVCQFRQLISEWFLVR